jgi:hypothetical protein
MDLKNREILKNKEKLHFFSFNLSLNLNFSFGS